MEEKKPFDHEDYRIPGTNAFNLSKWARENDPPPPGKYKVGDHVLLVIPCEVTRVYPDCDGTTLYQLDEKYNGFADNALLPGAPDMWTHDAPEMVRIALDSMKTNDN